MRAFNVIIRYDLVGQYFPQSSFRIRLIKPQVPLENAVQGLYRRVREPDIFQGNDLGDGRMHNRFQQLIDGVGMVLRSAIGYQGSTGMVRMVFTDRTDGLL